MSEAPDREAKTEEPTPKRLADTLEKGKGPVSRELPVMVNVGAIWLCLSLLLAGCADRVSTVLRAFIEQPIQWPLNVGGDASQLVAVVAFYVLAALLPIFATLGLAGLVAGVPQSNGFILTRIKPEASRISPVAGWKRLFGRSGFANALKSLVKLAAVAAVAVWSLRTLFAGVIRIGDMDVEAQTQALLAALSALTASVFLVYLGIGVADVLMVRFAWRRDLKMTKQEIKDESKQSEGDPALKHRQRLLARQRIKQRMLAAVPRATVVIVNPTHFAVALHYDQGQGGAPRVVAKGVDLIALRIRGLAEDSGVPVVENRMLARALHDQVPIDATIPAEFYKAVAQIIAFLSKPGTKRVS
jgi:flagellar biosynthesis protein FlhB